VRISAKLRAKALRIFGGAVTAFTLLAVIDTGYKASLPAMHVHNMPDKKDVAVKFRFTLDDSPQMMIVAYDLENKTEVPRLCNLQLAHDSAEDVLEEEVLLNAKEKRRLVSTYPYPTSTVDVTLTATCEDFNIRSLTEEKK
jgi:hypothetical protein